MYSARQITKSADLKIVIKQNVNFTVIQNDE